MFRVEMHTHVSPGSCDSKVSSEELMVELCKYDYNGVMITNHYTLCCVEKVANGSCDRLKEIHLNNIRECKAAGRKYGVKVYAGIEYSVAKRMHFSLIGITEDMFMSLPEPERSLDELLCWAKQHDVFVVNNHPCREEYGCVVNDSIGYEAINTKKLQFTEIAATECVRLTRHLSPVYICGGDIHDVSQIGRSCLVFDNEPIDERELMRLILNKQFHIEAPVNINELLRS